MKTSNTIKDTLDIDAVGFYDIIIDIDIDKIVEYLPLTCQRINRLTGRAVYVYLFIRIELGGGGDGPLSAIV